MKGYELIKEIADGKVNDNTEIYVYVSTPFGNTSSKIKYKDSKLEWKSGEFDTSYLFDRYANFSIIEEQEEQEEIDIQNIEEIEPAMNGNACVIDNKTWTLNQVIKAVKQLDKKIK